MLMAMVSLVNSQLTPPHIKKSIKRKQLRELGFSIISHRVTTITAPAGYGKSVWVASLLQEEGWPSTAWLSLERCNSDPSFFLYHLIHAFKKIEPEYGIQSLRTLNSLRNLKQDYLIAVSSIIQELPQDQELVLVLDDYHLIDQNQLLPKIMEYLIRRLPVRTHIIIVSRTAPNLNLYQELLKGELLEISSQDLLFAPEEIGELLSLDGLVLSAQDSAYIHHCTGGWAAGVRLLGLSLKRFGGDWKKNLSSLKGKNAALYSYLSHELLAYLTRELQDFLLDSSLLPYLEPNLCQEVLGDTRSKEKINELHLLGLLNQVESDTTIWHFHHLIGDFLLERALNVRSPEYITSLRRRAAVHLEKNGDIDKALEQLSICADWSKAVDLILTYAEPCFLENGRNKALYSWIKTLPADYLNSHHRLLYYKGICIRDSNPQKAQEILSQAAALARDKGDIKGEIRSLMAILAVHIFSSDSARSKEVAGRIATIASHLKDSWARGVMLVTALGKAVSEDDLKRGLCLSRLAAKTQLEPEWQLYYFLLSGIIHYRLGNLDTARQLAEKALARPLVQKSDRWLGVVYVLLSGIYCNMGKIGPATEISRQLIQLGHKYHIPHQIAYGHRRIARTYLLQGKLVEARYESELCSGLWLDANNEAMSRHADLETIFLSIATGENAENSFQEKQAFIKNILDKQSGYGSEDYSLSIAGVIAREAGQVEQARQWLEESAASSAKKGAKQLLAGTLLHLASLYLMQGNESKADHKLQKALGLAQANKINTFWDWHPETVYRMCRRALLKNIYPQWAFHILQCWFSERLCEEANPLLVNNDENICNATTALIQSYSQKKKGLPIVHVNFMGGFQVFVNGVIVPATRWKTKKAENLFKYLILNRSPQAKEKVFSIIWPEAGDQVGDASLRMALTHVRQALNLSPNINDSVLLRRGMISLNPGIKIFTDYELFISSSKRILHGIGTDPNSPDQLHLLEYASWLYQGEFLPDNIYEDWTLSLRHELRDLYVQIQLKRIEAYIQSGQQSRALELYQSCLAIDPMDERIVKTSMELLISNGQKHKALQLYKDFAQNLAQEYKLEPSTEIKSLREKIK